MSIDPGGQHAVKAVKVAEIERGDTIWCQQDDDWFKVDRIHLDEDAGEICFYRDDNSEVSFAQYRAIVLRRVTRRG